MMKKLNMKVDKIIFMIFKKKIDNNKKYNDKNNKDDKKDKNK